MPGMDLKEFPAFVVAKFGVHNINPLLAHFKSTEPRYLEEFRISVERAGSHVVDLGLPGQKFYDPDAAARERAIQAGRKWIDIAAAVGSPSVRQHLDGRHGVHPRVDLAASSLGQLAEYGAKRNIVVNLENDDPISENPFFLVAVIAKVNSPFLRGLPDFGNSLAGHDSAYNERAVKAMFGYAYNMAHVKDGVESDTGKTLIVDVGKMFQIAQASSYKGYFSMELDSSAGEPVAGTRKLIEQSLQCLEAAK